MTTIDLRRAAAEIQRAALLAADPAEAVRRHVRRVTDWLLVEDIRYHLTEIERVFVVAIGKASMAMADFAFYSSYVRRDHGNSLWHRRLASRHQRRVYV